MAPEYAMHGCFSAKSDVFSFGVLVLEIITGRQNGSFNSEEEQEYLLTNVSNIFMSRFRSVELFFVLLLKMVHCISLIYYPNT